MSSVCRTAVLSACVALAGCADRPEPDAAWRTVAARDSTGAVVASITARDADGPAGEGQRFPPSIYVRCDGDGTSVYVDWRADLGRDTVTVTYALDGGPERTDRWAAASGRSAAGRWSDSLAVPLLDALLAHDRMTVSVEAASGPATWAFSLDGLAEASEPVRELCDRPEAAPALEAGPDGSTPQKRPPPVGAAVETGDPDET